MNLAVPLERHDLLMRADRAAAGFGGTTILVVIALAQGGLTLMEPILLVAAGLVVLATFAPALPALHRLRIIGAPRVSCVVTFGDDELVWEYVEGAPYGNKVLRVGLINDGPRRAESVSLNVLVDAPVNITASDYSGEAIARGSRIPETVVDGRSMRCWSEQAVTLPVATTLFYYNLSVLDIGPLSTGFVVRMTYSADDLHGRADRVCERRVLTREIKPGT